MRSSKTNATHFLLRRNLFIGVVVFLVIFFTLPMWGLSHIPETKKEILLYQEQQYIPASFADLVSNQGIHTLSQEGRCLLYGALGFLTALMLFRHLFSRKQGMLHAALPDKREKEFLRRLIGYGVLGLGPIVLNYLIYLLIVLVNGLIGYVDWSLLLSYMGMMLLVNLYGFATGVLACALTGTWWAALVAGAVLLVGLEGLAYVWTIIAGKYLHTFVNTGLHTLIGTISPTCTLYKGMYKPGQTNLLPGIISIVCSLGAGFWLYRIRRTESTEKTLAFGWLHGLMSFILPVMGGSIMGIILMYSFMNETGLILGMVLGALLTYWVCRMVFEQRFCGILKKWYLPAAAAIVLVLGVVVLHTDALGYDHYLPSRDQIMAVSYSPYNGDGEERITLSDPDTLDAAYAWCNMMRDEVDGMEDGLYKADMAYTETGVVVTYHLNGRNVTRRYPNASVRNDAQPYLQAIIESDDYRASLISDYHLEDGGVQYIYLYSTNYQVKRETFYEKFGILPDVSYGAWDDVARREELLVALKADLLDRSFADKKKQPIFSLDISWEEPHTGENGFCNVPIFAGDENVLRALFGDKMEDVVDFSTSGYAVDENYVVLQVTHSASRREMETMGMDSFDLITSVKEAATPEERVEWIKAAQHPGQNLRYFMPDYEDVSYSNLYIYNLQELDMYLKAGDNFTIPEDRLQMVYDRTIPISFTMHCIGK